MPGIVGLVTDMPREQATLELARMIDSIEHESFYRSGMWVDASAGIYVGWVARKDSFSDAMPVCNERGDVVLIFSGEEFPEPGTARRLRERGHTLELDGPSYLAHLYEDDPAFLSNLNGTFHGIVADRTRRTATLFNDRYGMHRLYYHQSQDAFYFAAEAKAILAAKPELRAADARGLGELVACGCVLENRTIFKGIHLLPPASAWAFRNKTLEVRGTYFDPRTWERQEPLAPELYYRELRDVFARNLPRFFDGHERVGIALTGGLDTRMIMAWRQPAAQPLPCYTFGSMFRETQDVRVARRVARVLEQPHEAIPIEHGFLSRFGHYAERSVRLSDGCVDVSRAADLYVSEKARAFASAKVVGTYGSEMLSLTPAFKPMPPPPGLFEPEFLDRIGDASSTYAEARREHPMTFTAFRQSPWWHYGIVALEQTQLTVRSPYLDNDFIRTIYRAPLSAGAERDVRLRLISDGNRALGRLTTDRGVGGDSKGLSAVVARSFLEFTLRAEYAYDYNMPQWLARIDHLLSPLRLERLFLGRHKMLHYRVWYREALSSYVRDMLLDARTLARPYLKRGAVESMVRGHLEGYRNYTREIHKLLTLEILHRAFFDHQLTPHASR